MSETLQQPESAITKDLHFKVGYYSLILAEVELSPEWKELYQERLEELQEQLDVSLNTN